MTEKEIMSSWESTNCLVSICSLTFNHEAFIEDALKGFLMQKTTFAFEVLIHDDASTDRTQEIIKGYADKYPGIIKPIFQTVNQKSIFKSGMNPRFNFPRAKGKYIALCEGDDYWTDPLKLQKQVDFLEANPEFSICFHHVKIYKENEGTLVEDHKNRDVPEVTDIYELSKRNYIHTPSVIFRKNEMVFDQFIEINSPVGDYVLHMLNAMNGKIKKLPDCMAVYRVHEGGIWSKRGAEHILSNWLNMLEKITKVFNDNLIINNLNSQCSDTYSQLALLFSKKGNEEEAKYYFLKAMENNPEILFHYFYNEIQKVNFDLISARRSKAYNIGKTILKPVKVIRRFLK